MGLWEASKRRFKRRDDRVPNAPDVEHEIRLYQLSERLRMMRGNITTPMEFPRSEPRSSDAVERLSRAARDGRNLHRSNGEMVLRGVREYRSIDD